MKQVRSRMLRSQDICLDLAQVQRFAQDVVAPKVREMDENEMMDPSIIKGLFEQGVCSLASQTGHRSL